MQETVSSSLGSMASVLTRSRKFAGMQDASIDRALGAAASLGLSLAILRWVVSAYSAAKRVEGEHEGANGRLYKERGLGYSETISNIFFGYIRRFLRRLLLEDEHDSLGYVQPEYVSASDGVIITHQGACHCESVRFEIIAPRCLAVQDGPGKIQYKHTHINSSDFRVLRGHECLKTYYVASRRSPSRGAHAFCERCGVHILYAPCKNSPSLFINVNCVAEGIRRVRLINTMNTISDGVSIEGQWDDQLSTISEVTQDFGLMVPAQLSENVSSEGSGGGWRQYDRRVDMPSNDYLAKKAGFSLTPTTVSSYTAAADSQEIPPLRITPAAVNPNLPSLRIPPEAASIVTDTDARSVYSHATSRRRESPLGYQQTTAMPELRDQMKFFMKKHLSSASTNSSLTNDEEKKSMQ